MKVAGVVCGYIVASNHPRKFASKLRANSPQREVALMVVGQNVASSFNVFSV